MPQLELLYASNNLLESIPDTFAQLPLTDLYISENKLRHVPACSLKLQGLQKLSLACNELYAVPTALKSLSDLKFLDLSFNQISSLPPELAALSNLIRLNLSFNPLGDFFPMAITGMFALKELNLDFTGLKEIPQEFGKLTNLQAIQLQGNPLDRLFDCLYKKNPLLLMQIFNQEAESLNLSQAGLDEIPAFIGRLTCLKRLDLRHNRISSVPVEVGLLNNLDEFLLEGNPLQSPFDHLRREPYGDMAVKHFLDTQVVELDLTGASLVEVPPLLMRHGDGLSALNMNDNALKTLPQTFAEIKNLRYLSLDNNLLQ